MFKNKAKRYCIASGCRTSDKNSTRSFFSLPTQQKHAERRQKWLKLLGREDLLGKCENKRAYFVCSAHFDRSAIKIVKHLNDTALPTKCLANQPQSFYPEDDIEHMEGEDTDDDDTPLSAISNPKDILISVLPNPNKDIKVNIKIEPRTDPQTVQEFSKIEPRTGQELSKIEPQTNLQIKKEFSKIEPQSESHTEQAFPEQQTQTKLITKLPKKRNVKKKKASGHSWMKAEKEKKIWNKKEQETHTWITEENIIIT